MAWSKFGEEVVGPGGFGRQPVRWLGSGIDETPPSLVQQISGENSSVTARLSSFKIADASFFENSTKLGDQKMMIFFRQVRKVWTLPRTHP
jgi:hypothetical protein